MTTTETCGCTYQTTTGEPVNLCDDHRLPPLETPCADCMSGGTVMTTEGMRPCPACEGVGQIPTPAGRAMLDLVRRHVEEQA